MRYPPGMVRIDPSLERIAARLSTARLRAPGDEDDGDLFEPGSRPFVDLYTVAGLRHALTEYGITAALEARGLGDHEYRISRQDDFRHRLEIVLSDGQPIMDLHLHLREAPVAGGRSVGVVVVEWLLMQNPRATFDARRPRFPGQHHPGTGMGRLVHSLLVLLCRRLGRDALLTVPERFHLAALYRQTDYVAVDPDDDVGIIAALQAGQDARLSMAGLAWAVERGCVVDVDETPWSYRPHTLVCPVSDRVERALRRETASLLPTMPTPALHVDVPRLQASLSRVPVPGLPTIWRDPVDGARESR
jgi:hypothetical protein